jgi:anaerobic magnesium-protoporphyrin IX monomethyl ester cyclase
LTKDGLHNSVVTLPEHHARTVGQLLRPGAAQLLSQSFLSSLQTEAVAKDRRELQRNLKGFITLSKYLLRGSQHEKTEAAPPEPGRGSITPIASPQGGD